MSRITLSTLGKLFLRKNKSKSGLSDFIDRVSTLCTLGGWWVFGGFCKLEEQGGSRTYGGWIRSLHRVIQHGRSIQMREIKWNQIMRKGLKSFCRLQRWLNSIVQFKKSLLFVAFFKEIDEPSQFHPKMITTTVTNTFTRGSFMWLMWVTSCDCCWKGFNRFRISKWLDRLN